MRTVILAVDWSHFDAALQQSRRGHNLTVLSDLSGLLESAESDVDRAGIRQGEASCYSQLGDVNKALERLMIV